MVPGKHSFSGYQFPKLSLAADGIELGTHWPLEDHGTVDEAFDAFVKNPASALMSWMPSDESERTERGFFAQLKTRGLSAKQFPIAWKSSLVPHGPHVVRASMAGEVKVLIWELLNTLHTLEEEAYDAVEPDFSGGFQQISLEDYRPVFELLKGN